MTNFAIITDASAHSLLIAEGARHVQEDGASQREAARRIIARFYSEKPNCDEDEHEERIKYLARRIGKALTKNVA